MTCLQEKRCWNLLWRALFDIFGEPFGLEVTHNQLKCEGCSDP